MQQAGAAFRGAGVRAVYLAHGTFVGSDALGILNELSRVYPAASRVIRQISKRVVDGAARGIGNYTRQYAEMLEAAINEEGALHIPVRRFVWSSENNHIGRADGAVRLIEELAQLAANEEGRVLLWGHSHAGNVFALASDLLAADDIARKLFFETTKIYYRWPIFGWIDIPLWEHVRKLLRDRQDLFEQLKLDIVTFGTPIRYGWNSDGYDQLLHFVNHRPATGLPIHQAPFPTSTERILSAADGDYVQQFGIAGTNIMPSIFAWRSWLADKQLNQLLQSGIRCRNLIERLRAGRRVPEEGTTLLVDYGRPTGNLAHHLAGHAVYTLEQWMLFHVEEIAQAFYSAATSGSRGRAA